MFYFWMIYALFCFGGTVKIVYCILRGAYENPMKPSIVKSRSGGLSCKLAKKKFDW